MMDRKSHWEAVYSSKGPSEASWYQPEARLSMRWIQQLAPDLAAPIIDVGGGASVLVDQLLAAGYINMTVLDLVGAALQRTQRRLGEAARRVRWIEGDVLSAALPPKRFAFWHDRAVFHFLTDPVDRVRYVAQLRSALEPGGYVLIATFAADGPTRCSGLDVARYTPSELHAQLGTGFELVAEEREEHRTPTRAQQAFTYCICRWRGSSHATA
jgi:SAM-dependent methyltransferase